MSADEKPPTLLEDIRIAALAAADSAKGAETQGHRTVSLLATLIGKLTQSEKNHVNERLRLQQLLIQPKVLSVMVPKEDLEEAVYLASRKSHVAVVSDVTAARQLPKRREEEFERGDSGPRRGDESTGVFDTNHTDGRPRKWKEVAATVDEEGRARKLHEVVGAVVVIFIKRAWGYIATGAAAYVAHKYHIIP